MAETAPNTFFSLMSFLPFFVRSWAHLGLMSFPCQRLHAPYRPTHLSVEREPWQIRSEPRSMHSAVAAYLRSDSLHIKKSKVDLKWHTNTQYSMTLNLPPIYEKTHRVQLKHRGRIWQRLFLVDCVCECGCGWTSLFVQHVRKRWQNWVPCKLCCKLGELPDLVARILFLFLRELESKVFKK